MSKTNENKLEKNVEERTKALVEMNRQLRREIAACRRAGQALSEEVSVLRSLIDALPDYIYVKDTESRFILNNQAHLQALGAATQAELLGKTDQDVFPGELARQYYADEQVIFRTGRPLINREEVVQDAAGNRRWMLATKMPLYDCQGTIVGLAGNSRDITERKQVEEALRESEEKFRQLADNVDHIFWIQSPDGSQIFYINPAYERVFGRTCDSLLQDPASWFAAIHPEDRPEVERVIERHTRGQGFGWLEYRVIRPDGQIRWVRDRATPLYDEQGQIYRVAGITADITERKQAERAMQQRNQELALLHRAGQVFNSSLDLDIVLSTVLEEVGRLMNVAGAFWLVDPQGDELVCRQASGPYSERVRGWRIPMGEGLVGWVAATGQSLVVPDTRLDRRHFSGVDETTGLESRSIVSVPLKVKQAVTGVLQLLDTTAGRFDTGDLALIEPLAATAAIAIENARLYEQTRQDAQTKSTLLEEVNHRVKNNLATIVGLLHIAQRYARQENQPAYQVVTNDLVKRIQGLSTVYRLLSTTEWSPVLLTVLAGQMIRSAGQELPSCCRLDVEMAPSSIHVNPVQASSLAIVINELAMNSIQHALGDRTELTIFVTAVEEDGKVTLEFRDDGPGYPAGVLERDQHHIGLYLIRSIVRTDLQGEVRLYNNPGSAASICFKSRS